MFGNIYIFLVYNAHAIGTVRITIWYRLQTPAFKYPCGQVCIKYATLNSNKSNLSDLFFKSVLFLSTQILSMWVMFKKRKGFKTFFVFKVKFYFRNFTIRIKQNIQFLQVFLFYSDILPCTDKKILFYKNLRRILQKMHILEVNSAVFF